MKKYRKILIICLGILFICMITGDKKRNIIKRVEKNIDTYTQVVEQILESKVDPKNIKVANVKDIAVYNDVQIDFTCKSGGFGSGTYYMGFYYSVDDMPRTFQGGEMPFEKYEKGLKWEEEEGDNWCYIEKIYDHWYYFEMHF